MAHKNCITDQLARQWWRDYRRVQAAGNPYGLSFVEYVANRALAESATDRMAVGPHYMASCGHVHAWGASCSALAI